jgi:hypothetical protein
MMKGDMSPKAPVIGTEFWIEGNELDPDEFTRLVGIQPYRTGKKDDISSHPAAAKQGVKNRTTFWFIEVEHNTYSMDEGIQAVLRDIWSHRERILEYVHTRPSVKMGVKSVIHIYQDRPVYDISPDSIKKLADLGCGFMIGDIYPLEETES